jgi:hypothetical protein
VELRTLHDEARHANALLAEFIAAIMERLKRTRALLARLQRQTQ